MTAPVNPDAIPGAGLLGDLLQYIGPMMAIAIALSVFMAAAFCRTIGRSFLETVLFVSPFAWLGAAIGYIAGSSEEELIGAVLTGLLTVAGTLISYMITKDDQSEWRAPLPLAMMLLFLCSLVGITTGAGIKGKWDDFDREYAKWLKDYETITLPARAANQRYKLCVANVTEANRAKCDELLLKNDA